MARQYESLEQILQYVFDFQNKKLRVDASGATIDATIDGVTIDPATDFRPKTYQVTALGQITFGGFSIKSITIKALSNNPGYVRIGKSNVDVSTTEFYLLSPGESLSFGLDADTTSIYYAPHPGEPVGNYYLTVFATNA